MSAATIHVRDRATADLETCGAILRRVHDLDGYPVEGVTDTDAWLNPPTLTKAWVATLDHKIVGHTLLASPTEDDDAARLWQEQSGTPMAAITVLGRLFVDPLARGHDAGSHLMKAALGYATSHQLTTVLDVIEKAPRPSTCMNARAGDRSAKPATPLEPIRAFEPFATSLRSSFYLPHMPMSGRPLFRVM